jgi:hypothetical protein
MKKFLYALFSFTVLFSSCQDEIQLELTDPVPQVVIDGCITTKDTVHYVRISSTQNYLSSEKPDFTNEKDATVNLYEDGNLVTQYIFNDSTEQFETSFRASIGRAYVLEVQLANGTTYLSEEELTRRVPPIDSVWVEKSTSGFTAGNYDIIFTSLEPAGVGDNYQWKLYYNGEYQNQPFDLLFAEDRLVDGNVIGELPLASIDEEKYDELVKSTGKDTIRIVLDQTTITRNYYEFLLIVQQQTAFIGGPFDSPPAPIRGNIYRSEDFDNRALGFFYAASVETAFTKYRPE